MVSTPWDEIEQVYDYLGSILKPFGLVLDYERIKETRPVIAEMLRR